MGCVWSKRRDNVGAVQGVRDSPELGYSAKRTSGYSIYDSTELAVVPSKAGGGGKLLYGLEKAVDVLDTLGSSMSGLNTGSGFIAGNRGNQISILAFEVANTIAKAAKIWNSFSEESIRDLKSRILKSEGVGLLVSQDDAELLRIAAMDKRDELVVFSREVIRFGDLCKDPVWHNLGRYFQKLDSDFTPQDQSKDEMEKTVQNLIDLAQNTSELYHELNALDRFDQDYQRKFREEKSLNGARKESVMILLSELKRQRKYVKALKKKSLWSKTLEEVVEKLVDIVIFLHKQIRDAFIHDPGNLISDQKAPSKKLGEMGLALHYANIITQIDNIVCRPLSLPPSARDNLYHGLPISIKSSLRNKLNISDYKNENNVAEIKNEMQKTLTWLVPLAENTIRAHQGFGWVGEWASLGSEMSKKSSQNTNITRIQTLHHADKEKTEQYILNLVILLHHLVIKVKTHGYGFKTQNSTRSNNKLEKVEKNDVAPSSPFISQEERKMLESLRDDFRVGLKRSKSCEEREKREKIRVSRSRSFGNSTDRVFGEVVDCFEGEKIRVLDVMDGLDIIAFS